MSQIKGSNGKTQIEMVISENGGTYTEFAGVLALWRLWHQMDVPRLLQTVDITYGEEPDLAPTLSFAATIGPLVGAASDRRIAQRFGGEASREGVEADGLLRQFVKEPFSQRTLNRFVAKDRHPWRRFHQALVRWLQQQPGLQAQADGVVILDDFPIPKPYAEKMASLSRIRDQNQDRYVMGYQVVHLYYHHPQQPDYSLYVQPWKKSSALGEAKPKPRGAQRPARPDEQRSRLDIALDAVRDFVPLLADYRAVVFDSWYTARWLGHELTQLDIRWIGAAESTQKFELAETGEYLSVPAILERFWDQCQPVDTPEPVRAIAIPAIIRGDRYTKVDQPVQLVLARPEESSLDDEEPAYYLLICNQHSWSAEEIVSLFQCRPQIEVAHRQGKQQEGWVDFQYQRWPCFLTHFAFALLRSLLLILLQLEHETLEAFSVRQLIAHVVQAVAILIEKEGDGELAIYLPRGQPAARRCLARFSSSNRDVFVC